MKNIRWWQWAIPLAIGLALILLISLVHAQVPVQLSPYPNMQFLDATGAPLAGGKALYLCRGNDDPASGLCRQWRGSATA